MTPQYRNLLNHGGLPQPSRGDMPPVYHHRSTPTGPTVREQIVAKLRNGGFLSQGNTEPTDADLLAAVDVAKRSRDAGRQASALAAQQAEDDALYDSLFGRGTPAPATADEDSLYDFLFGKDA